MASMHKSLNVLSEGVLPLRSNYQMNKVNITIPKAIWNGDQRHYAKWCWETYGRYLQDRDSKPAVELNIKFARF